MKQFWITVAGVFAGLVLFFVVIPILLVLSAASSLKAGASETTPSTAVIALDLRSGLSDQGPSTPFAVLGGGGRLSVVRIVQTLDRAGRDDRVKALFVRLPEGGVSPAAADELRQAFRRFRASGKPVVVHSQGLQPVGAVVSTYMLGASGSELWMQSNAQFGAVGMATEDVFLARAFQRFGVRPEFEQRYEYKNAVNGYTQSDYTPAHREATLSWMGSVYETALTTAAGDRHQTPAALRATIEGGPWTAEQARQKGLIDKLGQVEEAEQAILTRAGSGAKLVDFNRYAVGEPPIAQRGPAIALIGAEGAIMTGADDSSPFSTSSTIRSDVVADAFHAAIRDKDVKAIVFRVSSPGGSDVASEQILAAVRAARAAGKPVVVSMGEYAASGGYWISSEASAIVAQPTTLTGSIGVFGGKFVVGDALGRYGADMRSLSVGGDYAQAFAAGHGFSPSQRARFAASIDGVYDEFVRRVSVGRHLPEARVRDIARGRVWTGAQARELGLVDELGGLDEAVARAQVLARMPAGRQPRIKRYPEVKSPFEALGRAFGVSSEGAQALIAVGTLIRDPHAQAVLAEARTAQLRQQGANVMADTPAY